MRNLDFGFDVITRRERDHQCREWTTQGAAPCYVMGRDVLSHGEPANESREWHLVTWYGVTQYVDLRPRKTSLESVFIGPPPEQQQVGLWAHQA